MKPVDQPLSRLNILSEFLCREKTRITESALFHLGWRLKRYQEIERLLDHIDLLTSEIKRLQYQSHRDLERLKAAVEFESGSG